MSEQKTAKVLAVLSCREWQNPKGGSIWFHKVELDNGEIGEIGKKKQDAFKIGDPLAYTSEKTEYGLKFKEVFSGNGFGGFRGGQQRGSSASFALSYAKDIAVANISKSDKPIEMEALAGKVIATAAKFQAWLKENE